MKVNSDIFHLSIVLDRIPLCTTKCFNESMKIVCMKNFWDLKLTCSLSFIDHIAELYNITTYK